MTAGLSVSRDPGPAGRNRGPRAGAGYRRQGPQLPGGLTQGTPELGNRPIEDHDGTRAAMPPQQHCQTVTVMVGAAAGAAAPGGARWGRPERPLGPDRRCLHSHGKPEHPIWHDDGDL